MLVKDWMTSDVIWINEEAPIQEALKLMKNYGIRHLPVMDKDGGFVGWITDSDVRGVLIASMLEEISVSDVMIRKPISISPSDHLEDAARIMVEQKIGGLPVLEEGKLVGVVTVVDVLRAFLEMLGTLEKTRRIDFSIPQSSHIDISTITNLIENSGGKIRSICKFYSDQYSVHLDEGDARKITETLRSKGINIL